MDELRPDNQWMAVVLCGAICAASSLSSTKRKRKLGTIFNGAFHAFFVGCIICCIAYEYVSYAYLVGICAISGLSGSAFMDGLMEVARKRLLWEVKNGLRGLQSLLDNNTEQAEGKKEQDNDVDTNQTP